MSIAHFQGGSLEDCNLDRAKLSDAYFEGVTMFGASFCNADLSKCEFYLVLAMGASFERALMRETKLIGGSFEDVNFSYADLTGASFLADNMGGEVDLSGADFTNANLNDTIFNGVLYSMQTKFPEGFLPGSAGLRLKNT
ncbi:pentapeptide repeat-containing protein [Collimonas fungivorans]|uniref:pentapeptide repeat-containing protein n=1 Tax=Collimonas fungivorans TaxID=158899 RepID=UPI0014288B8A|nr:pentapeptide repeat-containing protein [Collimonas fungivorans]